MTTSSRNAGLSHMLAKGATKSASRNSISTLPHAALAIAAQSLTPPRTNSLRSFA
jgi:hypothetical protein